MAIDPFSGKPLRYAPERRIIWSYGSDEQDDDGDWDFDAEIPEGRDLVWRIPGPMAQ